jgi:hypothetical protein
LQNALHYVQSTSKGLLDRLLWRVPKQTSQYLQQLQNEVMPVIQGTQHMDTIFPQQDGACPHTANVILDALHDVW